MRDARRRTATTCGYVALIAWLWLLAAAGTARAQHVRGRVIDPAKEPLDLVQVQLLPLGRHVVTGGDGTFAFADVPPGTYTLRARRLGFREMMESITVPMTTAELTVTMQPVPVELDTVYTRALQQELPYLFQRMKEHLGAVAFGPDLMKRFPGASLDEVLRMDPKLWQQLSGAQLFGCKATAYIDGRPALPPLGRDWAHVLSRSYNPATAHTSAVDLDLGPQVSMRDVAAVEVFNSPDFIHEPDLGMGGGGASCRRIVLIWTKGYVQPRGADSTMHGHHPPPY